SPGAGSPARRPAGPRRGCAAPRVAATIVASMTSSVDTTERVRLLREAFTAIADPARAIEMRAYQRDQFPFFGIPAPARRAAARPVLDLGRRPDPDAVVALAEALWREPERECAYAGTD